MQPPAVRYDDRYCGHSCPPRHGSGFVCQPGTTFAGEDELHHICQKAA